MNQSARDVLILWSVLAIVLGVTLGIGTSAGVHTEESATHGNSTASSAQAYPGPSEDYAVTPHSESLIYDMPGGDHDKSGNRNHAEEIGELN